MLRELQPIVESLAEKLGRAVAVDDPRMRLLAHTAHNEPVDKHRLDSVMRLSVDDSIVAHAMRSGIASAAGPVRVPGIPEKGLLPRLCIPVRCQNLLLGYLWLIDEHGTLTDAEIDLSMHAADEAGQRLFHDRLLEDAKRSRSRGLVRDLLSDDPVVRSHAAQDILDDDDTRIAGKCCVVVWRASTSSDDNDRNAARAAIDSALHRAAQRLTTYGAMETSRAGGTGILLVSRVDTMLSRDGIFKVAQSVREELLRVLGDDITVRAAVGMTVSSIESAVESSSTAHDALRVSEVVPGIGSVVDWESLGIYRMLAQLPLDGLPRESIPRGLLRLIEADDSGQLVHTLEVYLDMAGSAQRAADTLHVHRGSLYYRLSRIEDVAAVNLADGGERLGIHLGIKLARLTGMLSSPERTHDTPPSRP